MKTIIFDFDGTIADSFAVIVAIFHQLTHRSQLVTPEEIVKLRRMRLLDVAKAEHISRWRMPFLLMRGRRQMTQRLGEVQIFGGMSEVLAKLHKENYQLFIMSSNSAGNVHKFLKDHQLDAYFNEVYGGVGLLGKARALKQIMRQNHLKPAECLYVGDEPRDIEGSREAGVACIAVSWGFNAASLLLEHQPLAVVDTPENLLATITKHQ